MGWCVCTKARELFCTCKVSPSIAEGNIVFTFSWKFVQNTDTMESFFLFDENTSSQKWPKNNYEFHLQQIGPQRPLGIRQTSLINNPAWSKDPQTQFTDALTNKSSSRTPSRPHFGSHDVLQEEEQDYQPVPSDTLGPRGEGAGQGVIGVEMLICPCGYWKDNCCNTQLRWLMPQIWRS